MLINGEKYACDACIRGHRVSSCQHHDRPLSHINRKGRPVSQCPHCRGLRKSRTSHVSCQCGEKPHNKGDCKNGAEKGSRKQCCCGHGSRCICAAKRDSNLATVPEVGPAPNQKSTFQTKQLHISGAKIDPTTVSHRTKAKHNNTSKRAHPYPMPRSHTIHSVSELARHSAETLPLPEDMTISRSVAAHQDSITSAPRHPRRARSEHGSPVLGLTRLDTQVPPFDIPYSTFDQGSLPSPAFDYPQQWAGLYYPDTDITLEAASLGPPSVDWSTFDLAYGSDALTATYSQPPSYASFDHTNFSHPELSRSSSHDTSDPEEFAPRGLPMQTAKPDYPEIRTISDGSEAEAYHLSASPSHPDMPQSHILDPNRLGSLDMDMYWQRVSEGLSQPSPLANIPLGPELPNYSLPQTYPAQQTSVAIDSTIPLDAASVFTSAGTSDPIWIPSASPFPPVLSPVSMEAGRIVDQAQWQA
ncbi:uncharacterized protein CIMG_01270 [Coccidioides immitis RS]|uniref:Copper-fist domain-containing protein n=3 Tax=Coccidioides immitis TaxID=5501 RepID=J3KIU3_COCIM|nr:uncharacterized protein CIMG_01270 [Coccidioides immitis RS]EAS35916.3 hypothetical protein CIMG_01270 [Coccidioides immitis RS]KMP01209.1 hypothetical protein CIRG_01349 [Coccidioides immitis RMSCC 2394]KMU75512.1 hypothetical protein CISG_05145 [Coccidioides immitis RMSCC 3703]TPX25891.1 hypothetical protein DIZ76_011348 [Coccidioides immitis]